MAMRNKYTDLSMLLIVMLVSCAPVHLSAQRHFYHRLDFGSSNIYTFVGSNLITGFANYLAHDILFDNSYIYSFYNVSYGGENVRIKAYNPIGITGKDLLNDILGGAKFGYQSDNTGNMNWGVYASGHYKLNQFKARFPFANEYSKECLQYLKPGIGLFLTIGSIEKQTKIQIESSVRYNMPIGYHGGFGDSKSVLNKGFSSYYAIKIAGYSWFSAGIYSEFNHYNFYKKNDRFENSKSKMYNIGLVFTITPKRGEDIYD